MTQKEQEIVRSIVKDNKPGDLEKQPLIVQYYILKGIKEVHCDEFLGLFGSYPHLRDVLRNMLTSLYDFDFDDLRNTERENYKTFYNGTANLDSYVKEIEEMNL